MKRRTIRKYVDLFRNPARLSVGGPDDAGARVTLFPNGEREIWSQTVDGLGVRVSVSDGPHGLGVKLDTMAGTPPITIASPDGQHVELCQYRTTPKAAAFRRWYLHEETADDVALLGPGYQRA